MASLYELYVVGADVLQLYAVDRDSGENGRVTFSLVERSSLFVVSTDGRIMTASSASFDRESQDVHYLTVKAMDGGNPQQTGISASINI